jgi:hypothetical protein
MRRCQLTATILKFPVKNIARQRGRVSTEACITVLVVAATLFCFAMIGVLLWLAGWRA